MEKNNHKKYPPGHWLGIAMGAGLLAGLIADILLPVFVEIEWLWFGVGSTAGLILGALAGLMLEKHNLHLRHQLSKEAKERHRQIVTLTVMSVMMLVVVSVFLFLKKLQA